MPPVSLIPLILLIIILPFALTGWLFAPWIPIDKKDLERLGKILKLKKTDVFYELGSGDGRVIYYIHKTFGCKCVGVELNPYLYLISLIGLIRHNGVVFKLGDLFSQDLSAATCVYLFGLPRALNHRIKAKLEKELSPKAKIVCYGFGIDDWKPDRINRVEGRLPIFIYGVPQTKTLRTGA